MNPSGDVHPPRQTSTQAPTQQAEPSPSRDKKKSKTAGVSPKRPSTIAELFAYAYKQGDRKLDLTQSSMRSLKCAEDDAAAEVKLVAELAANDHLLDTPRNLLASIAELTAPADVQKRVIQLISVALTQHPVFDGRLEALLNPTQNEMTPTTLVTRVDELDHQVLGFKEEADYSPAKKDRLKLNAAMTYALIRVLRDNWTSAQLIESLTPALWRKPQQSSVHKVAALFATSKATEELSQLSAHYAAVIRRLNHELDFSKAEESEARKNLQTAEIRAESSVLEIRRQTEEISLLTKQMEDLGTQLASERDTRNIDKNHLIDDLETLRSRVIRNLSSQIDLLADGLHAVRNGRPQIAEEFMERALYAIKREVDELRESKDT